MREVVLDTETTGLDPAKGDRIVEVGCVELINHLPTGRELHLYVNPERDVPLEAQRIHGLSDDFLADKPVFSEIADHIFDFIEDSPLIIHNATFDMRFLNAEFKKAGRPLLDVSRAVDTLKIAQSKFPGSPASLDALCRRFDIDASARQKHGALIDSYLLAEVYLELIGGRAPAFSLDSEGEDTSLPVEITVERTFRPARPQAQALSAAEIKAHEAFLDRFPKANWLWRKNQDTNE